MIESAQTTEDVQSAVSQIRLDIDQSQLSIITVNWVLTNESSWFLIQIHQQVWEDVWASQVGCVGQSPPDSRINQWKISQLKINKILQNFQVWNRIWFEVILFYIVDLENLNHFSDLSVKQRWTLLLEDLSLTVSHRSQEGQVVILNTRPEPGAWRTGRGRRSRSTTATPCMLRATATWPGRMILKNFNTTRHCAHHVLRMILTQQQSFQWMKILFPVPVLPSTCEYLWFLGSHLILAFTDVQQLILILLLLLTCFTLFV